MQSLQQSRRRRLKDVSNFTLLLNLLPKLHLTSIAMKFPRATSASVHGGVAKAAFDLDCDEIPESDQRVAGTLKPTRRLQDAAGLLCMTTMEAHSEASTIKPQIQFALGH